MWHAPCTWAASAAWARRSRSRTWPTSSASRVRAAADGGLPGLANCLGLLPWAPLTPPGSRCPPGEVTAVRISGRFCWVEFADVRAAHAALECVPKPHRYSLLTCRSAGALRARAAASRAQYALTRHAARRLDGTVTGGHHLRVSQSKSAIHSNGLKKRVRASRVSCAAVRCLARTLAAARRQCNCCGVAPRLQAPAPHVLTASYFAAPAVGRDSRHGRQHGPRGRRGLRRVRRRAGDAACSARRLRHARRRRPLRLSPGAGASLLLSLHRSRAWLTAWAHRQPPSSTLIPPSSRTARPRRRPPTRSTPRSRTVPSRMGTRRRMATRSRPRNTAPTRRRATRRRGPRSNRAEHTCARVESIVRYMLALRFCHPFRCSLPRFAGHARVLKAEV